MPMYASVAPIIGSVIRNILYRLGFRILDIGSVSMINYRSDMTA